jgi:tRNA1Val (adenine37-N6)-methyltransferase
MTAHYGASETVGIELQQVMADLATRNAALNELSGKVSIMNADLLAVKESFKVSCFDIVLSNPPFRKPGSGRISPKSGRDLARHESTADLSDFLSAAKYLVKPGGRIFFVYLPYRMQEFMAVATELKLSVKRVRMIHGTAGAEARIFLAELVKGGKSQLVVEPPLVLYREGRIYTDEAEGILGEGN